MRCVQSVRIWAGALLLANMLPGYECVASDDLSAAQERWAERLRSEAPLQWEGWRRRLNEKSYQVEVQVQNEIGSSATEEDPDKARWRPTGSQVTSVYRDGERRLALLTYPPSESERETSFAWGTNERYYFVLKRIGQAPWAVRHLGRPDSKSPELEKSFPTNVPSQSAQLFVEGLSVEELVNHPSFQIVSVEERAEGELVEVAFSAKAAPDEYNTITGGRLWFRPDMFWLMKRYEVSVSSSTPGVANQTMAYRDFQGLPVLDSIVLNYKFEGDPPLRYTYSFDWKPAGALSNDLFTLSNFDLPEPGILTERDDRRIPGWIWFNAAAIILIGLAFLIRRNGQGRAA